MIDGKECTRCHIWKSYNLYYKFNKNGYRSWCKQCVEDWRINQPKVIKDGKECTKCYKYKNSNEFYKNKNKSDGLSCRCITCEKEDRLLRRGDIAIYNKKYKSEHKEEISIKAKEYVGNNREHINKRENERSKNKRLTNSDFYIAGSVRIRMNLALKGKFKYAHTEELLGIPILEYKQWLQFTADMNGYKDFDINNWNHKKFHIDHIVPCSWFNLIDPNQQRECFYFMNTQILMAEDNNSKLNRFVG